MSTSDALKCRIIDCAPKQVQSADLAQPLPVLVAEEPAVARSNIALEAFQTRRLPPFLTS